MGASQSSQTPNLQSQIKSDKQLSEIKNDLTSHISIAFSSLGLLTFIQSKEITNILFAKICIIIFALTFTIVGLIDYIKEYTLLKQNQNISPTALDNILSIVYLVLGILMCFVILFLSYRLLQKNKIF